MTEWLDVRMDDELRVRIPIEALGKMGWGYDTPLCLSVSPGRNALLLRAQKDIPPVCCACGSSGPLLPVSGGKWVCTHCFEIASLANRC